MNQANAFKLRSQLPRLACAALALLLAKVLVAIVWEYHRYFPADFNANFLLGRVVIGQFATGQSPDILETPRLCFDTLSSRDPKFYDKTVPLSQLGRGGRWADGSPGDSLINTILPPNSPSCAVGGRDAADGLYSVSSVHHDGAQVLLADAAVRFIAETIDAGDLTQPTLTQEQMAETKVASPYGVWGALGTKDGGETIGDY
ncbi:DUF1559 family PulG-like putative transporter [Blastopirellula marina]|uniref:DUF1559 domain-containing protein n=1 Tax=Blastopirellula marina DSM 3645 TaxID=314230 RepID=A3ZMI5_9BACT|nr:DUF1559 domain-containing protein [Blastopirellula marina]EAQ82158.1 hypothetical protein DSM3645_00550 [Blastopirellula marina DSM 3645]